MRDIKVGDKITVLSPLMMVAVWGINGLTLNKEYEVLGVGTPPDGWPPNDGCPEDAVYFLCDDGLYTQLDGCDVTLVE